ncbi:MAG: hypothetical protein BWY85_01820 [Firmicutes bacterium ADurb.Bin506]|nr:MAG: hypothetical protein BWY85_01820 [Firmicutes bacterium ADurb.Bin506]
MASDVRGPVATTTTPSVGSSIASCLITFTLGCDSSQAVTCAENSRLSTANACPAATLVLSAHSSTMEPRARISCFSRPGAVASLSEPSELLHTNSAKPGVE